MRRSLVPLLVALVAGVLLAVGSAAFASAVTHHVSVGSADVFLVPPGGDANFSLVANEGADGTVRGQWQDTFFGRGVPAQPIHVVVTCLEVDGNDAWASGTVTFPAFLAGLPVVTRVRDNGTSATDPADQIGITEGTADPNDCVNKPNLALFDLNNGQAVVR